MPEHEFGEVVVLALGVLAVVLEVRREAVQRGDLRPRSAGDDVDQPGVIDVLMGDDQQLEALIAWPAPGWRSSSSRALPEFGPESISVSGSSSIR